MKQIEKPNSYIDLVLGKQAISSETKYKLSQFCVSVSVDDGELLYNNLTKELIHLTKDEFKELSDSDFKKPEPIVKSLIEQWFLVSDTKNEIELCEQIREFSKSFETVPVITHFNILPTTGCNARCFYCFEAGAIVSNMNEKTADDVVEYIVKNSKSNKISLIWFGGEPLCNTMAIDRIIKGLNEKGINFTSRIITNGYLFDEEIIIRAKELWHLSSAQITLDGMHATYKNVKNYKNDDPAPLEHVLQNIGLLLENNIHVGVRLNMDSHNSDELFSLVDFLYNRFEGSKKLTISVVPLYEGDEFVTSRTVAERDRITSKAIELIEYIDSLNLFGVSFSFDKIQTHACQADSKRAAFILPDGHLGFCEHYVDKDFYGTIYDDVSKPIWSARRKPTEECKTCAALPNCVNLERCPVTGKGCNKFTKYLFYKNMRGATKNKYMKYREKIECKENE